MRNRCATIIKFPPPYSLSSYQRPVLLIRSTTALVCVASELDYYSYVVFEGDSGIDVDGWVEISLMSRQNE